MKRKLLGFVLPFLAFTTAIPFGVAVQSQTDFNSQQIKSSNSNNHSMVDYSNADSSSGFSRVINVDLNESYLGGVDLEFYEGTTTSFTFRLNDGYVFSDFDSAIETTYFTLYDVTTGEYQPIGVLPLTKDIDFETMAVVYPIAGAYDQAATIYLIRSYALVEDFDGAELEEFHQYRIGFNINEGDDYEQYSNIFELETPELITFDVISTDTSFTINYALSTPSTTSIQFEYNDLYIKINDQKYTLDNPSGQLVVDGLKPATEYQIDFGYNANKIVSNGIFSTTKEISNEKSFSFSTNVPSEYQLTSTIAISFILLIILIIIFLILVAIILYWNHQRRKVSGLSLVVGEDTQAYDPVYDYNYHREENQNSSSDNNVYYDENGEIDYYGEAYYSDDYYEDDEYYSDEGAIDDYENAHEDFDEMEEWK